jgi:hypothetical protein
MTGDQNMTIKSLLLGSAAAMMAVTGANAADAVFAAEPEPMDYVKICDTYGNGFYYIPGTETCLRIGGYARVEYIYTDVPDTAVAAGWRNETAAETFARAGAGGAPIIIAVPASTISGETGNWVYRARVNIDARNETDWGTLRSQIRFQGDGNGGGDGNVAIDRLLISLGGLRFGYSDSFVTTHHGYGWQKAANDGYYSFAQALLLDYTFAANGFSATVGIQDTDTLTNAAGDVGSNIDPYAGVAYSASWGRVAGSVIYDNAADALGWKASVNIQAIENLGVNAWYAGSDGTIAYYQGYQGAGSGVEWEWGIDVNYQVNSQFNVWAGYTDADFVDAERFAVGAIWNPVSGLSIRPEAVFGDDYTQVRLRVVRSF